MAQSRDNSFAFLGQAKPGSLFRLLDKLPRQDQAMVLANLQPALTAQVMAYFPDTEQGMLMAAMREARRAPPEAAAATVERLRELIAAAKEALPARPAQSELPKNDATQSASRPASGLNTAGKSIASAYGKSTAPGNPKPQPWKPRVTDETPINAPPKPNRPPPVAGNPAKSPLAANILDFFGLRKPKGESQSPSNNPATAALSGKQASPVNELPAIKKEPQEGVIKAPKLQVSKTPRILGTGKPGSASSGSAKAPLRRPPPNPEGGTGRRMDGMSILAAILRNASVDVRNNVAEDSPALFKALKERMFVFDDLIGSDDDALAQVFTVCPLSEAALALRFAPPVLRERALKAVSPRRADMLRDVVESSTGKKSGLDAIEAAQNRVLDVALRLQSAGRIVIDPDDPDLAT